MIYLGQFSKNNKKCICNTPDLIENYDKVIADTERTWECHHRLETHSSDGKKRLTNLTKRELIALGMYYDRPPEELIFLTKTEHRRLHPHHDNLKKYRDANEVWNRGKDYKNLYSEDELKYKFGKPKVYIKCIETGETKYQYEWYKLGFFHAGLVASGKRKTCRRCHFEFVRTLLS